MKVDAKGWGWCEKCDEYLVPKEVKGHKCGEGKVEEKSAMTLGEAAWGPGGCYEQGE